MLVTVGGDHRALSELPAAASTPTTRARRVRHGAHGGRAGGLAGRTPFLAPATGEEIGVRTNLIPKVSVQVAVFQE